MFFIFLIFCSFLHFFDLPIFFIFLKKEVSSFLVSSISFKKVLLLASVSEFNCSLRSECSVEMWCLDDMERGGGLGWATYLGKSMIQLARVE